MKKPFVATIEFEVVVLAESEEDAAQYVNSNIRTICNDTDLGISAFDVNLIRPKKFPKLTANDAIEYVTGIPNADELMYNTDADMTVEQWFQDHPND